VRAVPLDSTSMLAPCCALAGPNAGMSPWDNGAIPSVPSALVYRALITPQRLVFPVAAAVVSPHKPMAFAA